MSAPSLFYEPIARDEYLERLEITDSSDELSGAVWDHVHELVQERLAELDHAVKSRVPAASVQVGRTAGRAFPLFTYRTFSRPREVVDPVVVGVTFTWSGPRIRVEADASGEQSGDRIVTLSPKTVPSSRAELIQAACEFAERLRQSDDQIAAALADPSRDLK